VDYNLKRAIDPTSGWPNSASARVGRRKKKKERKKEKLTAGPACQDDLRTGTLGLLPRDGERTHSDCTGTRAAMGSGAEEEELDGEEAEKVA
jgi:hypothetical protein